MFGAVSSLLAIFIPYLWLKKKYDISIDILGLRKGEYSPEKIIIAGSIAAVILFLIVKFNPFWLDIASNKNVPTVSNVWIVLLVPFTLIGFIRYILSPFGEEIFLRGFIYGYLKKKTGKIVAIFIQSLISSAFHIFYIREAFQSLHFFNMFSYLVFINIVFCLLYEKTKSLYSSIICHGMFNYFLYVYPLFQETMYR